MERDSLTFRPDWMHVPSVFVHRRLEREASKLNETISLHFLIGEMEKRERDAGMPLLGLINGDAEL